MQLLILLLVILLGLIVFTISLLHTGNWKTSIGHALLTLSVTVLGLSLLIAFSQACREQPVERIDLPQLPRL